MTGRLRIWAACALFIVAAVAVGCSSTPRSHSTGRVDPDRDDKLGGTGTESGDIRMMCDQFVRSMLNTPAIRDAKTKPRIALLPVKNRINDVSLRYDTDILLVKMRAELNQCAAGKMVFLARDRMDDVRGERSAMEKGEVTGPAEKGNVQGADYFMTGEVRSLSKNAGDGKSTYLLYAFQLINTQTSEIVWEDSYEQKRVDDKSVIYR